MCSRCTPHKGSEALSQGRPRVSASAGTRAVVTPGRTLRRRAAHTPYGIPYEALPGAPFAETATCGYAELDRRARAVAARLGALVPPGSQVLLVYRQGPDFAGAFFGCLYAGMVAVPYLLGLSPADEQLAAAVGQVSPEAVLTGGDDWYALPVDRERTPVLEADGVLVGGQPVLSLAARWRPVGVIDSVPAYRRYRQGTPGDYGGGWLGTALSHGELLNALQELQDASRLGAKDEDLGWIASVQGLEDAVWRLLLPVHQGRTVWEVPSGPDRP